MNRSAAGDDPSRLEKHSVRVAGHPTSITLERVFWDGLRRIARNRGQSLSALITTIDATRQGNLSSALRVFVLMELSVP